MPVAKPAPSAPERPLAELVDAASVGPLVVGDGAILNAKGEVLFSVIGATYEDCLVFVRLWNGLDEFRRTRDRAAFKTFLGEGLK